MMTNVLTQAAEHRVEQLEAGSSLSAATLQFERQKRLEAERLAQVRHRRASHIAPSCVKISQLCWLCLLEWLLEPSSLPLVVQADSM